MSYSLEKEREYRLKNKERIAANRKRYRQLSDRQGENLKKYGITPAQYNHLLVKQGSACAICKKPETSVCHLKQQVRRLAVDHNHITGEVRGLLCGSCNRGIGSLGDSSQQLRAAAEYLAAFE